MDKHLLEVELLQTSDPMLDPNGDGSTQTRGIYLLLNHFLSDYVGIQLIAHYLLAALADVTQVDNTLKYSQYKSDRKESIHNLHESKIKN
eukprot:CAMPEP_0116897090 /NCGR_PEP_ID=MMETSP0467-20121206/6178_1 /TAXON_ID=283647 /ORGANISM="Mesodinium pulex, Strain SPMC105" /LENGTH=89 /DNA_ID=CAMNT_0004568601 /DNA_START=265 /DNA_END=534 /DNA_ORIENTATION=-